MVIPAVRAKPPILAPFVLDGGFALVPAFPATFLVTYQRLWAPRILRRCCFLFVTAQIFFTLFALDRLMMLHRAIGVKSTVTSLATPRAGWNLRGICELLTAFPAMRCRQHLFFLDRHLPLYAFALHLDTDPPSLSDTVLPRPRSWITDLKRVKLAGYEVAITELEVEWNLLFRAKRYLEQARAG